MFTRRRMQRHLVKLCSGAYIGIIEMPVNMRIGIAVGGGENGLPRLPINFNGYKNAGIGAGVISSMGALSCVSVARQSGL